MLRWLIRAIVLFASLRALRGLSQVDSETAPRRTDPTPPASFQARDPGVRTLTLRIMRVVGFIAVGLVLIGRSSSAGADTWEQVFHFLMAPQMALSEFTRQYFVARRSWPVEAWVSLVLPCIGLPTLALIFHYLDFTRGGGGIKDRIARLPRPHSDLRPEVISATMTKQSILAAISAIFLAGADTGSLTSASFASFATGLSRLGFASALLLLTVSALSYDYANRFKFCDEEKYALILKGLALDVSSWYVLIASFIVGMAAKNVRTSILVSIATGFLVRWYYFLEPKPFGGPRVRRTYVSVFRRKLARVWRKTSRGGAHAPN